MTPGVDRDVVLAHVLCLENGGEGDGTRTNDKESGLEIILIKEI